MDVGEIRSNRGGLRGKRRERNLNLVLRMCGGGCGCKYILLEPVGDVGEEGMRVVCNVGIAIVGDSVLLEPVRDVGEVEGM